jgi:hypothetical protein
MITIGIDPHKSSLTAVAVDSTGQSVATMRIAVTATTVCQLQDWAVHSFREQRCLHGVEHESVVEPAERSSATDRLA